MTAGTQRLVRASAWLLVLVVTLTVALRVHAPFVHPDGIFYFAQLRSVYFDRDIDFRDEAHEFPWIRASYGQQLPNGRLANPFPVGSPILWSPFYAAADLRCKASGSMDCHGYAPEYVRAVVVGTVFWTVLGCWLTVAAIRRLGGRLRIAAISVFVLAVASPLVFYVLQQADYSHGCSFFAASLVLYMTVRARDTPTVPVVLACGGAVGLAFLVRWQDAVFALLPLTVIVSDRSLRLSAKTSRLLAFSTAALLAASPQFVFWKALYGKALTIPQTGTFLSFDHIEGIRFLLSTWNGALLWHPILLPAFAGLLVEQRSFAASDRFRTMRWACVAVVLLEVVVSMMVDDWWAGGAFGQRRLVSILPLLALGLYEITERMTQHAVAGPACAGLAGVLIAWNLLTLTRFYEGRLPFNPPLPASYSSGVPYGHYEYGRRFTDILFGRDP